MEALAYPIVSKISYGGSMHGIVVKVCTFIHWLIISKHVAFYLITKMYSSNIIVAKAHSPLDNYTKIISINYIVKLPRIHNLVCYNIPPPLHQNGYLKCGYSTLEARWAHECNSTKHYILPMISWNPCEAIKIHKLPQYALLCTFCKIWYYNNAHEKPHGSFPFIHIRFLNLRWIGIPNHV